ncbi:MAG: polysaccharide biosynthesis tyrosine autokinase [Spirochaetia bacterium]|nr:polysaccharide biosynthesis tyrosine autokinase [Spirochaetia bacterium]
MHEKNHSEVEIDLKHYINIIYQRRWALITFFIIAFTISVMYILFSKPVYQATAQILIEEEKRNILDFQELYAIDVPSNDFYNTQYKLLSSQLMAKMVLEKLDFNKYKNVFSNITKEELENNEKRNILVLSLLQNLDIEPVRNSRLVKIHFSSYDPVYSADAANLFIDSYMDFNKSMKSEAITYTTTFLEKKLEEQKEKLKDSEVLLQEYKEKYNIVSMDERENISMAKLTELNMDVIKVENERVEAETRYIQAKKIFNDNNSVESTAQAITNPLINRIKGEESDLVVMLSELSKKYGKKHPKILTLKEKLKTKRRKVKEEISKVVTHLKNEYEISLKKESMLKKTLEDSKVENQKLNEISITFRVLKRDVETNKEIYNILLTRLKETDVSEDIQSSFVKIIDKAEVPLIPIKPKKALSLLMGLMMGVFGGIIVAILIEYLDNTVKTSEELKQLAGIPFLGAVSNFRSYLKNPQDSSLISLNFPNYAISEGFRVIRTSMVYSSVSEKNKTILITSAEKSDGKSTIASNLAITLMQAGNKVLLVDTDFRNPSLHKIFGFDNEKGFSNFLVGEKKLSDCIIKTEHDNFEILPCGKLPPNPSELIGSEKMNKTIEMLKKRYDKIIFDSAPVLPVTDSVLLSNKIDQTILVVSASKTHKNAISQSISQLKSAKANLIGTVLNYSRQPNKIYGYYGYGYGYGYGSSRKDKKKTKSIHNLWEYLKKSYFH